MEQTSEDQSNSTSENESSFTDEDESNSSSEDESNHFHLISVINHVAGKSYGNFILLDWDILTPIQRKFFKLISRMAAYSCPDVRIPSGRKFRFWDQNERKYFFTIIPRYTITYTKKN